MSHADRMAKLQRKVVAVECPELEETLYVRTLSVGEMRAIAEAQEEAPEADHNPLYLSAFMCSEDGTPVLSLSEAVEMCNAGDSRPARRLIERGWGVNALNRKAVEEARGN